MQWSGSVGDCPPRSPRRPSPGKRRRKPAPTESALSLFPQARHWGSIRGVATDESEKTQIDKAVKKAGDGLCGSKVGYACKKGLKPEMPNQDDFCILVVDGVSILGIFDGHGPHGHDIANFVQQHLPKSFIQHANFCDEPEKALMAAFPATHQLCVDSQTECRFDTALSGTTATLAMLREGRVYLGHVGDCRAVLARRRGSDLVAEDLTVDHKPTVESERRRVQAVGGVVRRLEGDLPHRVFLAGKMYPGLSMTRSIGDTVGAPAGVTSTPEVCSLAVEQDWAFMLLATDGVWEFVTPAEAVAMIGRFPPSEAQQAVESLTQEAWNRWIKEEETVVDDITLICIWFSDRPFP